MALRVSTLVTSFIVSTCISTYAFAASNSGPGNASLSSSGEPNYCDPANFQLKFEENVQVDGTQRLHVFRIGQLTLAGGAVGKAEVSTIQKMAQEFAGVSTSARSCTWYLNKSQDEATEAFNWRYVPRPYSGSDIKQTADKYQSALESSFAADPINMVGCAAEYGYIAMGCDGMRHRGPSVFAMLLAYSGCAPSNAALIANQVWGLNGVPSAARLEIAKRGALLGDRNPQARAQLQRVMSAQRH